MNLGQNISVGVVVGKVLDGRFSILGETKYEFFWLQF